MAAKGLRQPKSMPPTGWPPGDARSRKRRVGDTGVEIGVDQPFDGSEGAFVLLGDPVVAEAGAFAGDEGLADPRAVGPGDADLAETLSVMPFAMEPAALSKGRAQGNEPAVADGEHGANRPVEIVENARGLVDEQQLHLRVAAHGVLPARQANDARAASQLERGLILNDRRGRPTQRVPGVLDLAKQLARLPQTRRQDQHESGGTEQSRMHGQRRHGGALARLPTAVEQHLPVAAQEKLALPGIG